MGDQWFHPQYGVHSDGHAMDFDKAKEAIEKEEEQNNVNVKHLSAEEHNVVTCDKGYYFDMFCGKSKKTKYDKPSGFQVWIDTSSSLRQVDAGQGADNCARKSFVKKIMDGCGDSKVEIHTFDTSKKLMGGLSNLCVTYGLNDAKRLVEWVKNFHGKHLIVITDISEYQSELTDELDALGVSYRGHLVKHPIYAKDLTGLASTVLNKCK